MRRAGWIKIDCAAILDNNQRIDNKPFPALYLCRCYPADFVKQTLHSTMAFILTINDKTPKIGNNCFVAPNATIVGEVTMGDDCSIWFNAVVRGDVHYIKMGNKVNVQDGAVIHCTYQKNPTNIGDNVSIGHNAIVHGCTVHDNVLIGMGAIVMDRCVVNSNSIIAAGSVVLEGTVVEPGSIYAGVPAKKVKDISAEKISGEIDRIANNYVKYASWFKDYNSLPENNISSNGLY
jgi:carbonic anhydrase/acetyltransferase-like protein (isoleucine patch superfamily)